MRYWTGWQQVHEHLAKQTERPPTVLSADGSGVPYRRRAVICRCRKYLAGARSGFRSGCGQPVGAFREQPREQKRPARVGHHHGGQTCMGYRGDRCDCLPGPCPGGTLAIDLNDCDDFSRCVHERICRRGDSLSYVLATVCKRHLHQVGRVQGSNSRSR